MRKQKLLLLVICSLFLLSFVSAWMPPTHLYIDDEMGKNVINSDYYQACVKFPKLCYSGNELTDFSVVYYYTNFKAYAVTHSPSFCVALLEQSHGEEEKACAIGGCLHQAQDDPSHDEMVPYCIRHTYLPNGIIHPFCEQHADNIILSMRPELKAEVKTSLEDFKVCKDLYKRVLTGNAEYKNVNLDAVFDTFINEVTSSQTGYDITFKNISGIPVVVLGAYLLFTLFWFILLILLVFKRLRYKERRTLFNWISLFIILFIFVILAAIFIGKLGGAGFNTFVYIIKPVSNWVPIGDSNTVLTEAITNSQQFFIQKEQFLIGTDSSGQEELTRADKEIRLQQWGIFFVLLALVVALVYFNFRNKKSGQPYKNTFSSLNTLN